LKVIILKIFIFLFSIIFFVSCSQNKKNEKIIDINNIQKNNISVSKDVKYSKMIDIVNRIGKIEYFKIRLDNYSETIEECQPNDKILKFEEYFENNFQKDPKFSIFSMNMNKYHFGSDKIHLFAFAVPEYSYTNWKFIAIANDYSFYLLRGFRYNHFINLVNNEIGEIKNMTEYAKISDFYINTVVNDNYSKILIIDTISYNKYKRTYPLIELPQKLIKANQILYSFVTLEPDIDWIIKYYFYINNNYLSFIKSDTLKYGDKKFCY
jgi:hypothetical protein